MASASPRLGGIVPPLPTPLKADESIDVAAFERMADHLIRAGVHGLWVLGTTARFDLLPDDRWRTVAEAAVSVAAGRVPLVLNVSDMGTARTLARAARFDDLPFDYYAALPPGTCRWPPARSSTISPRSPIAWPAPWSSTTPPGSTTN